VAHRGQGLVQRFPPSVWEIRGCPARQAPVFNDHRQKAAFQREAGLRNAADQAREHQVLPPSATRRVEPVGTQSGAATLSAPVHLSRSCTSSRKATHAPQVRGFLRIHPVDGHGAETSNVLGAHGADALIPPFFIHKYRSGVQIGQPDPANRLWCCPDCCRSLRFLSAARSVIFGSTARSWARPERHQAGYPAVP